MSSIATAVPQFPSVPATPGDAVWAHSREAFRQRYNRSSFLFNHDLADNPLFSVASLLELARRQPQNPAYAFWSNGKVGVQDGWDAGTGARLSLCDTIAGIETNNSLVMLKHVEEDGLFGPVVREIQRTVLELAGPQMSDDVIVGRGTLLIASPRRVTSYHIDSDVNYLFQISGDKAFNVFDDADRSVTPPEELETYYLGNPNGAVFKPGRQAEARQYALAAGTGVHVPSLSGHWAQNLQTPSIALSINFDLRSVASVARIYKLNGRLRRHGLRPVAPGVSAWRDVVKLAALNGLDAARRIGARLQSLPSVQQSRS